MANWNPTPQDVTDPLILTRILRLLFDNNQQVRDLVRQVDGKVDRIKLQADSGTTTPDTTSGGGGGVRQRSGPPIRDQQTEALSVQTNTGQLAEPQRSRVPDLAGNVLSFGDDPTLRGYTLASGSASDYKLKTGIDGELLFDGIDPINSGATASRVPSDYNAMTWRFDGRDNIWKPLQALGCAEIGSPYSLDADNYARGSILYYPDEDNFWMCNWDPTTSPPANNEWIWVSGVYRNTLANIKTGLGLKNVGYRFYATDYHHEWHWTGSAWTRAPGDDPSGYVALFIQAPDVLTAATKSWHLCDGTAGVAITTAAAGTTNITVPGLTGTPAVPILSNTYSGPSTTIGTGTTGVPTGTVAVQSGSGTTVATLDHTHSVAYTDLDYMEFLPYIRR